MAAGLSGDARVSSPGSAGVGGARVELRALSKAYKGTMAVDDVSLDIAPGAFLSLLGPSGSGKTTTLNLIAGFIAPSAGDLLIDGRSVSTIPPHKRDIGMVFQSYALFPHMSVFDNVAYPLRMRTKLKSPDIKARVHETLDLVRLQGLSERYAPQLSGGQQQRVSMARALVSRPRLLLMDEPLGALDKSLREELQTEIKDIHRKLGSTFIYVTHDQTEALTMSDQIVVMRKARVAQVGAPQTVYDKPETTFVAAFLGSANLLPVTVAGFSNEAVDVRLEDGTRVVVPAANAGAFGLGQTAHLLIRPEDLHLGAADALSPRMEQAPARFVDSMFYGDFCKLTARLAGTRVTLRVHPSELENSARNADAPLVLAWPRHRARLLPGGE